MSGGVIAVDPGPVESALVVFDGAAPTLLRYAANDEILALLRTLRASDSPCVIEMIASYGMAVGAEVFETCVVIGRFIEAYGAERVHRITRGQVKMLLCQSMRAKDANIRQAILDKFGGKAAAIGSKRQPGPLRGLTGDLWAALAVGITYWDLNALDSSS
jgi:hypothetical protein